MGFSGLVLDGVLTPTKQDTIRLESTRGSMRVSSNGGIRYGSPFWHQERDFFGYVSVEGKPRVEKFLVADGYSHDLGIRFIERITVSLLADAAVVQQVFQMAHLGSDLDGLTDVKKEAKAAESSYVEACCGLPSTQTTGHLFDPSSKYPYVSEVLRTNPPSFVIERSHSLVGVDPSMFASFDKPFLELTMGKFGAGSPFDLIGYGKRSGNQYKLDHPEVTRISLVDPVVQHIPYQGVVHRKPIGYSKEDFANAMKDAGFTYQRATSIQSVTTYNTLERIADTIPTTTVHGRVAPSEHAMELLGQIHQQPGPSIVIADSALGSLLAQVGRFPTFLNGEPDLLFYGSSTYTAISTEGVLTHPWDLLVEARVVEGEVLVGLATALAAELYCSDVNLHSNKTDSITHTLQNVGRGMGDWYPVSVFSPQGEKFRSPVLEAINEDSYLF